MFVCKTVNLRSMESHEDQEKAYREFKIHIALEHDYITRMEKKGSYIDHRNGMVQMIKEHATDGTLLELFKTKKDTVEMFPEVNLYYITIQVLEALAYAHS